MMERELDLQEKGKLGLEVEQVEICIYSLMLKPMIYLKDQM